MPRQITSFSNDTVKRIRGLRDKKARKAEGMFLAEGLRILAEARECGVLPVVVAYAAQPGGPHPLAQEIIAEAEARGADIIETTPDILSKMSGKDNPQAILGVYRQPDTSLEALAKRDASDDPFAKVPSPSPAPSGSDDKAFEVDETDAFIAALEEEWDAAA